MIVVDRGSARNRLEELGLTVDILHDAVGAGELARSNCTRNDPPGIPGILAWGRTVRALREFLVPEGWIANDDGNFSTVVSPDGALAIAVATGNEDTGAHDAAPSTKYPKGPRTRAAVEQNQLNLFPEPILPPDAANRAASTWFLLVRRTPSELICEFSLPETVGDGGLIEEWRERIVLPSIPLDPTPAPMPQDEPVDPDVNVRRRA